MSNFLSQSDVEVEAEVSTSAPSLPIPYQPTPSELTSADVSNMDSLAVRWQEAIEYFSRSCSFFRSRRTEGRCVINAVIDISGSMVGLSAVFNNMSNYCVPCSY